MKLMMRFSLPTLFAALPTALAFAQDAAPAASARAPVALLSLPQDLSPWGMFQSADWLVKAVMIGLALASVITWTVLLAKGTEIWSARRKARRAIDALGQAKSLAEATERAGLDQGPVAALVRAAAAEVRLSADVLGDGLKERVVSRLERIEAAAGRRIARGTGVLASIGHGLGHHEQFHRHLEGADHQPRGGRPGHRRGAARDRLRPGGRDPGGGDLQHLRAFDRELPRDAG